MKGIRRTDDEPKPRKFGNKREADIAKGGYSKTPGSGASSIKGDLRRGDFMIEVKATRHESFRVTSEIMGKLKNDSLTNGKQVALIVEIGTGERYAILPLTTFERLVPDHD